MNLDKTNEFERESNLNAREKKRKGGKGPRVASLPFFFKSLLR